MLKQIQTLKSALDAWEVLWHNISINPDHFHSLLLDVDFEDPKTVLKEIKEARAYLKAHEQNAKHIEKATANPWPWYGDSLFDEMEGGDLW